MLFRCARVRCFETLRRILTAGLCGLLFSIAIGIIISLEICANVSFDFVSCLSNQTAMNHAVTLSRSFNIAATIFILENCQSLRKLKRLMNEHVSGTKITYQDFAKKSRYDSFVIFEKINLILINFNFNKSLINCLIDF